MKLPKDRVSLAVIRRLPKYYRYLDYFIAAGVPKISSKELGAAMGLTASQIRQDLNCFGGFGQQGYGYNVSKLKGEIEYIMGINSALPAILIGAGHLGRALVSKANLSGRGFKIVGIFDIKDGLVDTKVGRIQVRHMDALDDFCAERKPQMAIIAVPPHEAPSIVYRLAELGVRGFWNFAGHIDDNLPVGIVVEDMHLEDAMMTLSYRMKENNETE